MVIQKWVGARVGLMGNPSDGFGGKTIACLVRNFGAQAILRESSTVEIVRHPVYDPLSFSSLEHLEETAAHDGYYGGIRLLYATCSKFHHYCRERGIHLADRNFALQYDTNIPRQVGLGGSSAIIAAVLKALMEFYQLSEDDIPKPEQPNLILAVETDQLGIAAGLQDRVVQTYGGLVYMDFDPEYMETHGHGYYEYLDMDELPPMYLAYSWEPSYSGKMHNIARHRFNQGDKEVIEAVRRWAAYTDQAREALVDKDWRTLSVLMDMNFALRQRVYGAEHLGRANLEMINLARKHGLPAKFAGSGGAVVGFCEDRSSLRKAEQSFSEHGYGFAVLEPADYESIHEPAEVGAPNGSRVYV